MSAANDISALCSGAIESGNVERATIEVNGRQCSIKVSPSKIEGQQPQVKVSYASLASRQCQVKFTYDEKHISEQMEKFSEQMKISEFKGTITSIANYPDSPVKQENIDGRMGEIGKMLEGMRIFMQQNPVSEADMSILKAALNALASTPNLTMEDGKIHAISDCKDIATCRNVALQIEELQLLLYAKASGVGSIVALIVERLHQPIPKDQIGAQMGEIGKMLEDARIFVQQKPVSEAGMSVLKAALDALAGNGGMIQFAGGCDYSISDCKDVFPPCRDVALQIEGLQLLLDAKANEIDSVVAPIVERLSQPIAEDQVDAQMGEIGTMLEEVRIFVQQNSVSKVGMSILKAVLDALAGNEGMIQWSDGNFSINGSKDASSCYNVALQIEGLKLLLDGKANGIDSVVTPIVERLSQSIAKDQIDAQMVEIGMMLEEVRTFVQQNSVPEAGIVTLKAVLDALAYNKGMVQWSDGNNYSINDCKNGSLSCHNVALQIEGLKLLLDAKANEIDSVVAPIVERLSQPIAEDQVDAQMGEIGTMLEEVRTFVQESFVQETGIAILKTVLDKLLDNKGMIQWSNGNFSINDCKNGSLSCHNVALRIEGLKLLLDAKANEIDSVVAPIVERLSQPIAEDQVDAQMVEIGTMLGEVRTFVQQNSVSEVGMSILKAVLDALAGNEGMIQWSDGNFSINGSKNASPSCYNVALQIEGLKLLLDAKANEIDSVVAPIVERLSQPIAEDQIDAQMGEIGKMLEDARIFVQQKPVSEVGIAILKAALGALADNRGMIQLPDGNSYSISDCKNISFGYNVALQIEGLQLLLDAKANKIDSVVAPIVERLSQPIAEDQVDARMKEIEKMLKEVRTFVQQKPVSKASIAILKTALGKLVDNKKMIQRSNGNSSISDCKNISFGYNVALQVEELQSLLDAKANKIDSVVAPIVERLSQPIAEDQIDEQMGKIGKMLEDVRIFVQQKPVSEDDMPTLKTVLDRLAGSEEMMLLTGGCSCSIDDYKDDSVSCRNVVLQIEGLKLLLDAKANKIDGAVAPIVERLSQPIAGDQIDVQMGEIGTMLEGVKTFMQQNFMSEVGMSILKAALGKLLDNEGMIQWSGGNFSINGCQGASLSCRNVALQIEELQLLLDAKANKVDSIVVPIVERLHQPIVEDQVDAQMEEIEKMLEDVRTFVQQKQNRVSEAGIVTLKTALGTLAGSKGMIQWSGGNFSINDCDDIPACRKVASQIEGLQILLNGKIAAATRQSVEHAQRRMAAEMASECFDASGKIDLDKARELRDRIKSPTVLPEKFSTIPGAPLMLSQVSCVLDNLIDHAQETGSLREIIDRANKLSPGDHGRQILDIMGDDLGSPVKPGEAILISLFSLHRQTGLSSCTMNSIINSDLRNHPERIAKILEQILANSIFNLFGGYLIHQRQLIREEGRGYIPADLAMGNETERDKIFAQESLHNRLAAGMRRDSNNRYGLLIPVRNLTDVLFANFFQASRFGNRHLPIKDNLEHGTMFIYHGVGDDRSAYSELGISVAGANFEAGMERLKRAAEEQKAQGMHYMRVITTNTKMGHAENIDIDALLKLDLDALEVGKPHIIGDRNWIDEGGHPVFLAIVKTVDLLSNTLAYSFQTVSSGEPTEKEDILRFDVYQPL